MRRTTKNVFFMGSAADSLLGAIASHTEAPSLSSPPLYRMLLIVWFVKTDHRTGIKLAKGIAQFL